MARIARFAATKTAAGWMVSVPPKYTQSGKRERQFYKTREFAKLAADKLKSQAAEFGTQARAIAPSLAEAATAAAKLLEPWGVSILEAARIVAEIKTKENASLPVSEGLDAWLASCEGLRPKTLTNYKVTATRLRMVLGDKLLASVTAKELQAVLAPMGRTGAGVMEQLRNGKAWWRYCSGKGWYLQRTEWNVRDNDGTVVFTLAREATGGSLKTIGFAKKHGKPCIHIPQNSDYYENPALILQRFVDEQGLKTLNVAGSRESKEPGIYEWVMRVLEDAFFWEENHPGMSGGPGEG